MEDMDDSEVSFRIGAEKTRENLFCFFGLGNTGLIGDLETDMGLASCTTAVDSSSMKSSSSEKCASEPPALISVTERSVRIGSINPFGLRDLSENVLVAGDFSADIMFALLVEGCNGSTGRSVVISAA